MNNRTLYHHGIKGMKWGIRRTPEQLGRSTKTINGGRTTITPGHEIHRISSTKETTKGFKDKRTYVSQNESDNAFYAKYMTDYLKTWGHKKIYDMTYTNVKDIIYPTHEQQVKEFVSSYKNHKVVYGDKSISFKEKMARMAVDELQPSEKGYDEYCKNPKAYVQKKIKSYDNSENYYKDFIRYYEVLSEADRQPFESNLKSKGYNAVIDDNDARYNPAFDRVDRPSEPLIIFDPEENLVVVKRKKVK